MKSLNRSIIHSTPERIPSKSHQHICKDSFLPIRHIYLRVEVCVRHHGYYLFFIFTLYHSVRRVLHDQFLFHLVFLNPSSHFFFLIFFQSYYHSIISKQHDHSIFRILIRAQQDQITWHIFNKPFFFPILIYPFLLRDRLLPVEASNYQLFIRYHPINSPFHSRHVLATC